MGGGKVLILLRCMGSKSEDYQKLLKCVEDKLGLKGFAEARGYELMSVIDKDTGTGTD